MSSRRYGNGICAPLGVLLAVCLTSGCLDPTLAEINPCLVSSVIDKQNVSKIDKIDLLFVVDNSVSMEAEQEKLRRQLPRMIEILTTGDKTPEDTIDDKDFPPVKDLHLAVVSSDMGLPTVPADQNPGSDPACLRNNGTGDDGAFINTVSLAAIEAGLNCPGTGNAGYPIFLQHVREDGEDANTSELKAKETAAKFACISTLGTGGCGFEMQLEAPLKALWPSQINNLTDVQQSLEIRFLAGSQGRGDNQHKSFLRGTPYHPTEPHVGSLLAIIIVTDEEDCSAGANGNLDFLTLDYPLGNKINDANLRCYKDGLYNWGNRYPVERYINGFKALRPDMSDLVVFAAIAGIPNDIAEDANHDNVITKEERESFYNRVLNHPRMIETPEDPEMKTGYMNRVCRQDGPDPNHPETEADPARRLTEVARGFGEWGVIRSICEEEFTSAMDAIINVISNRIGGICLPRPFTRNSRNMVECNVIWTMPEGKGCDEPYLNPPPADRPQIKDGRQLCVVDQLPVINPDSNMPSEAVDLNHLSGLGWYYDDFSLDMLSECALTDTNTSQQRISFTLRSGMNGAHEDPPNGVTVDLECLKMLPTPSSETVASQVLEPCEYDDGIRCPKGPVEVGQLFCHEADNTCVIKCSTDADCKTSGLGGWICDARMNPDGTFVNQSSSPICINPTCS